MTPAATTRVKLADVADIVMGQSPPSTSYNVDRIGLPFLQGKAEFGALSPQPVKWCSDPKKIAEPGSVLLSVRAPVGDVNISDQRYCIGRGLAALVPGDNLDGQFLYFQLLTLRRWFDSQSGGSTFQSINSGVLYNLTLDLPDIQEQRRIARILSTIDQALTPTLHAAH
jgi:type I restriction enzyme S subunit